MTKRELTGVAAGLALWGMMDLTVRTTGLGQVTLINYLSLFAAALAGSWIAGRTCVKVARAVVLAACLIRLVLAPPGAVFLLALELLVAFTLATVAGLIVVLYRLHRFHHVPRRGQD